MKATRFTGVDAKSKMKPRKFKLHFNRINMQRGNPKVWTIHFSDRCIQVEQVVVRGSVETVFKPESRQPRAYFTGYGSVTFKGNTAILESRGSGK